jgi:hypothetical protein
LSTVVRHSSARLGSGSPLGWLWAFCPLIGYV